MTDPVSPPPLVVVELPDAGGLSRCLIRPFRKSISRRPFPPPPAAEAIRAALLPAEKETFLGLQMWRLHEDSKADILAQKGASWNPDFGIGVWLDQGPPTLWTAEEFMRLPPGSSLRPPMWTVIAVSPAATGGKAEVWRQMAGSGILLEFSVTGPLQAYLRENLTFFRNWIQEAAIRSQPFFVPLVRSSTFESAAYSVLEKNFLAVDTYLRESAEDEALLVVSRQPVLPRLERLGPLDRQTTAPPPGVSYRLTIQSFPR
ncbi:MAG: hypothetical protein ACPL7M_08390 [Bryobacteraceae bacterium]